MATTKITSPESFDLGSLNTALKLPSGTTAQRPTSPSTGEWRYNTTTNLVEFYDGAEWLDLQSENIPPIPSEHFNTVLYTGTGSAQSITGVGFKPDWVWLKVRSATDNHTVFDSSRGVQEQLYPNLNNAQSNSAASLTSFDTDGFTLGNSTSMNDSGQTYVAWCWKANGGTTSSNTDGTITSTVQANTKAGFSITTFAGTGSTGTLGHGLSVQPNLVLFKSTNTAVPWYVFYRPTGGNVTIFEGFTTAAAISSNYTNFVPNVDTVNILNTLDFNQSGRNYVMYSFASVAGYSKISTYTGNGSPTGPIENTGFEPAFVMIKRTDSIDDWIVVDNKRNTTNSRYNYLMPNSNAAENGSASGTINPLVNFLSNGFQIAATWGAVNNNGSPYVYIAFASDGSAAPALPDSFANKLWTGNGTSQSITGVGFQPDFVWLKSRSGTWGNFLQDSIRGAQNFLISESAAAQGTTTPAIVDSFDSDGFTVLANGNSNELNTTYVAWNWKAKANPTINTDGTIQSVVSASQAAGFSVVKYTGNNVAGATIGHGLASAPDMIIVKNLSTTDIWTVQHSALGYTNYIDLNGTNATTVNSAVWYAAPTSSVFSFGANPRGNGSGNNIIAYCFASISGFSKMGSYSGTNATNSITGLGFSPNWVMIKSSTSIENWAIFDTSRGSNVLYANTAAAESAFSTFTFDSDGFTVPAASGMTNGSGQTYIYMAFKENPTPRPLAGNMSFLVIAGGAGGGNRHGGGGGAGGLRTSYGGSSGGGSSAESDITLAAGTYTITVGGGGAGVAYDTTAGVNGTNSVLSGTGMTTITSDGGGGGGISISPNIAGSAGGSGGGGGSTSTGGSATANQGYNGGQGTGQNAPEYGGGGGGGALAIGNNGSGSGGGNGGNGLPMSITGSSVSYAGGGGGSSFATATGGIGGAGGGGNGAGTPLPGQSGTTNLGGGGGGTTYSGGFSGAGGSGVAILRLKTSEYSSSTTGSPTVTIDGDYTVLTYTGSGTYVHS